MRWSAEADDDVSDGRRQLRRVGVVAHAEGVVQDRAVFVVHHLGLVSELEPSVESRRAGTWYLAADNMLPV